MNAALISPSAIQRYVVTDARDHKTLKNGDTVIMTEAPDTMRNYFYRPSDCTLHELQDRDFEFIEVEHKA